MKAALKKALKKVLRVTGLEAPVRALAFRAIERQLRSDSFQSGTELQRVLVEFSRLYPQARFVQIGANDGQLADPLRRHILKHGWRGILVEPIPHIFAQLKKNYAGLPNTEGLIFAQVAVSEVDGERSIYRIDAPGNAALLDALTSLSREALQIHAANIPDLDKKIVEEKIQSLTFDSLCTQHGFSQLDLVMIDTEGYDYEILKIMDLGRYRPAVLIYEHVFLNAADKAECRKLVESHGYDCVEEDMDTLCVRRPEAGDAAQASLHQFFLKPGKAGA